MILLIKTKGHDYYNEIYSTQALNADFCYVKTSENHYSICLKPTWISQDEARDNICNPFIVARDLSIDQVDKYLEDLNNSNSSSLRLVESDGYNISFVDDYVHNIVINDLVDMQCISMIKIVPYEGDDAGLVISFAEFRQDPQDSIYADMHKYYVKLCKYHEARKIFDKIVYGLKEAPSKAIYKGTYNIII